jgi:hypothetical protein
MVEFVDIAGLVRGASKGEGLGNKFLSNIRECTAIVHIIRHFQSSDITHVENRVNPKDDLEIIEIELVLSDLDQAQKALDKIGKEIKNPKIDTETKERHQALLKIIPALEDNIPIRSISLDEDELEAIAGYGFLTAKKALYALNISESDLKKSKSELLTESGLNISENELIPICAKLESELIDLPQGEIIEYLRESGVEYTGLQQLIRAGYDILDYITMFTSGKPESRAWVIHSGMTAPQAAGRIHSDFEKGFICADVIQWKDLLDLEGWVHAREVGKVRMEGKQYVMRDGDVVLFKHNA